MIDISLKFNPPGILLGFDCAFAHGGDDSVNGDRITIDQRLDVSPKYLATIETLPFYIGKLLTRKASSRTEMIAPISKSLLH
jgi:hypothetical protein